MLGQHWITQITQTKAMFEARRLGTKHISLKKIFYVTKCLKSILIVKKKNKVTVLMLQDFKTYYKATIMKIVRERRKKK